MPLIPTSHRRGKAIDSKSFFLNKSFMYTTLRDLKIIAILVEIELDLVIQQYKWIVCASGLFKSDLLQRNEKVVNLDW